nr:embryogenesis-associated protein EMB8-like [Tanacetum cinerariifolium]
MHPNKLEIMDILRYSRTPSQHKIEIQRFYDHVLGNSLNGAANLRQEAYARLSDKEGIEKKIHNLLYLKPR